MWRKPFGARSTEIESKISTSSSQHADKEMATFVVMVSIEEGFDEIIEVTEDTYGEITE